MAEEVEIISAEDVKPGEIAKKMTFGGEEFEVLFAKGNPGKTREELEEIKRRGVKDAMVTQTGCIGICQYEPVVEVFEDGKDKVTYVKMTADKAKRVVAEHLKGGKPVEEYVIGNK